MTSSDPFRDQIARSLDWTDAHVSFDAAVADLSASLVGRRPDDLPHSIWELVEHIRIVQRDLLDFCTAPDYEERNWPQDYWPTSPAPVLAEQWEGSIRAIRSDREALKQLALNPDVDLLAPVPNGTGQSYLRELLLVLDHAAYHVGQLVLVRRSLGNWPSG
jgi:uncharacterized damage-inducible protein DinB